MMALPITAASRPVELFYLPVDNFAFIVLLLGPTRQVVHYIISLSTAFFSSGLPSTDLHAS